MKLLLAACLSLSPALLSAGLAEEIQTQLKPFEILHGHFEETKSIQGLEHPLKSSGAFVIVRHQGVLWESEKPFVSSLRLNQDGIREIKDGKAAFELQSKDEPILKLVNTILLSLFSADIQEVLPHFELKGKSMPGHWEAELKPKDAWMSKVAERIEVEGASSLERLRLKESNGDQTLILFQSIDLKSPLSEREKALFQ